MHRILAMCTDAAIAALILIPIFLLLDHYYVKNIRRSTLYLLLAVYLAGMFAVVGLPDICYVRFDPHFNWTPFAYMFSDYMNSLLNVLLFVPLGFLLPCCWKRFSGFWHTLLFGFGVSLLIEALQIFTFRASDVNDLMTNTLGTILGWLSAKLILKAVPGVTPGEDNRDVYLVSGVSFAVMFFLQPFLAKLLWNMFH